MSIVSYAQNFEDIILWRVFQNITDGFYIDIGAQDPVVDSVSLLFYEHGWRGVHIEPVSEYAHALQAARPDETVIRAAVSSSVEPLRFFAFPNHGLSTTDSHIAMQHVAKGYQCIKTIVKTISLDDVLNQYSERTIHWLKLDIEGAEKDALESWQKSSVRPWVVVIESTSPMSTRQTHHEWEHLLVRHGYTFAYFDGINRFYVSIDHHEFKSKFESGPNFFDEFQLTLNSHLCQSIKHSYCALSTSLEKFSEDNRVAGEENEKLRTENEKLRTENEKLRTENKNLNLELASVCHSISWRITAPLRRARRIIANKTY